MNTTLSLKLNSCMINIIGSYLLPDIIEKDKDSNLYRLRQITIYLWSKLNDNYHYVNGERIENLENTEIYHNKQNGPDYYCDLWDIKRMVFI